MAIGVGCGAFGAHGLRDVVPPNDLQIWEKAVFYQLIHGIAALAIVITPEAFVTQRKTRLVATLFLIGTVIFSGSLYALVLLNQRWLGAITPLGGTSFIAGWGILAWSTLRAAKNTASN
jgi:uncharacterized membrane protein YgdD (TMEM256/DUF423 family)